MRKPIPETTTTASYLSDELLPLFRILLTDSTALIEHEDGEVPKMFLSEKYPEREINSLRFITYGGYFVPSSIDPHDTAAATSFAATECLGRAGDQSTVDTTGGSKRAWGQ